MSDIAFLSVLRLEHSYVFEFQWAAPAAPSALYSVLPVSSDTAWQHSDRIDQAIRLLNQLIGRRGQPAGVDVTPQSDPLLSLGRLIYNQFFPPAIQQALQRLPAGAPLVIATNDTEIPWEIAHDGESYLALKYAAGRRFLAQEPARNTRMRHGRPWRALLIGNPTANLPEADAEMDELYGLIRAIPGTATPHILMRRRATKAAVLEALAGGQYDLIHYSGHAILATGRPEASGLVLAGDVILSPAEITQNLGGNPVIFLNACESARGDADSTEALSYPGLAAQNLAAAFVQGGAQAFIGTLWPVLDQESRRFAFAFYRSALVDRSPIGAAMREARAEIRQMDVTNPLWASFTLYGEPDAILPVPSAGTHATATVLVVALAGLDALYEGADEDQVAEVVENRLLLIHEKVGQQGGQVFAAAHSTMVCVFGTQATHENDAERAVCAALDIVEAIAESNRDAGREVSVGVGVAAGAVFIRQGGRGEQAVPVVTGQPVSQAEGLARRADDNTVLITDAIRSLIYRRFVLTRQELPGSDAAGTAIDGIRPAYRVHRRSAAPVWQLPGHDIRLVGRSRELAELQDAWEACARGACQLVGIGGVAGVGKSRLLHELYRVLAGRPSEWVTIACSATYQPGPFWLVAELAGMLLGRGAADEKLQQPEGPDGLSGIPPVPLDAQMRLRRISLVVDRLSRLLSDRAAGVPVVIVLEDLHWADADSLEVLGQLWNRVRHLRVLVISSFRSETDFQPPWWNRSNYRPIRLQSLQPRETGELLVILLGSADAPQGLTDALLGRCEGNPFFVRELFTALQESNVLERVGGQWRLSRPIDVAMLPGSLERVILSRIERLPERARLILSLASVAGDSFEPRVLESVLSETGEAGALEGGLAQLENGEFIQRDWDDRCHFSHALMQEVAYQSQRNEVRQRSHRRLGHALARFHRDDESPVLASLAHHFYRSVAIRSQPGAPDVVSRDADVADLKNAATYLIRAAKAANRSYAAGGAIEHWQGALRVLDHPATGMTAQRVVCYEGLGDAYNLLGAFDEAIDAYRQAFDLLAPGGDEDQPVHRSADLARRIGRLYGWQSRFEEALGWMATGLQVLGPSRDDAARATAAMIHVHTGTLHYYRGHYAEAETQIRQGLDLVDGTDRMAPQAEGYNLLGAVFDARGDRNAALDLYQKSLSLWEAQGDTYQVARVEDNIGIVYFHLGRWHEAEQHHRHALDFFEAAGDRDQLTYASLNLGNIHLCRGEWPEAVRLFGQALQLSEETGNERIVALSHNNLGLVALEQGDWAEARLRLQRSLNLLREKEIDDFPAETCTALALAHLGAGEVDAALAAAEQGLEWARAGEMELEEGVALRALSSIHSAQGDPDQAEAHLHRSLELLQGLGAKYEWARTLAVLAAVCRASGRQDEARRHLAGAIEIFGELGAAADLRKAELLQDH